MKNLDISVIDHPELENVPEKVVVQVSTTLKQDMNGFSVHKKFKYIKRKCIKLYDSDFYEDIYMGDVSLIISGKMLCLPDGYYEIKPYQYNNHESEKDWYDWESYEFVELE